MNNHSVSIIFVREYKYFSSVFSKKNKEDYLLNVNKILKDKFKDKFIVPNKVQSFILNYEIKKLLDKAIHIKNKKYKRIIYLNSNISSSSILNTISFIESEYDSISFNYCLIDTEDDIKIPLENFRYQLIQKKVE
jgi:hypothetical protein